jgi:hypothetical protein
MSASHSRLILHL